MGLEIIATVMKGTKPVPGAQIKVQFEGSEWEGVTNREGIFRTTDEVNYDNKTLHGVVQNHSECLPQDVVVSNGKATFNWKSSHVPDIPRVPEIPIKVRRWWRLFMSRVVGAALLRPQVYEEIEVDDTWALWQALGVVVLACLVFGWAVPWAQEPREALGRGLIMLVAWAVAALVTFFVGTQLLRAEGTRPALAQYVRSVGFATAPLLLAGLAPVLLPAIGDLWTTIFFFTTNLWQLFATFVAVRVALNYRDHLGRAVGVTALLGLVMWAVIALLWWAWRLG